LNIHIIESTRDGWSDMYCGKSLVDPDREVSTRARQHASCKDCCKHYDKEKLSVDVQDKLEQLAESQSQRDLIQLQYNELRAKILGQVQDELDFLDVEFASPLAMAAEVIEKWTGEIKDDILQRGASVKGSRLQAVFVKGRVTWQTDNLDGFATAYPELLQFRKVGQPSVTIRNIK